MTHLAVMVTRCQGEQGDWASWGAAVSLRGHVPVAHDWHRAQRLPGVGVRAWVGLTGELGAEGQVLFHLLGLRLVEVVLGVL